MNHSEFFHVSENPEEPYVPQAMLDHWCAQTDKPELKHELKEAAAALNALDRTTVDSDARFVNYNKLYKNKYRVVYEGPTLRNREGDYVRSHHHAASIAEDLRSAVATGEKYRAAYTRMARATEATKEVQNLSEESLLEPSVQEIIVDEPETKTQLSQLFPVQESILRPKALKPFNTLNVSYDNSRYAGLAACLQNLAAQPIHKNLDGDKQWKERRKELEAIGAEIENNRFGYARGAGMGLGAPSQADREALGALDRLLTLNKGSGEKQKIDRVKQFVKCARADRKPALAAEQRAITAEIHDLAKKFNDGLEAQRALNTRRYSDLSAPSTEPTDHSIAHSGIYAQLDAALHGPRSSAACWEAIHAIQGDHSKEDFTQYPGGHAMVQPTHLDYAMQRAMRLAVFSPRLSVPQRVGVIREALAEYRPAAEQASRVGAMDARSTQHLPSTVPASTIKQGYDYARAGIKPPSLISRSRIDDTAKKATLGLGLLSLFAAPAVYFMRPAVNSTPVIDAAETSAPFDANALSNEMQIKWQAGMDAGEASWQQSSDIVATPDQSPSAKPYRAPRVDHTPLPAYTPTYESREERDYQACLERAIDPATDMLREDAHCISPDIRRMEEEADRKFGSFSDLVKPANPTGLFADTVRNEGASASKIQR